MGSRYLSSQGRILVLEPEFGRPHHLTRATKGSEPSSRAVGAVASDGNPVCYPLVKKAKQMRHTFHFVAVRRRMPAAQVLPSATRPRLFAGD